MGTDFNIKPAGAPVAAPIAQPIGEAVQHAVATVLRPENVTAVVVYQVVDNRTSLVVKQFPEDAALRRRAYVHTLALIRNAPTRLPATDRIA